MIVIIILPKSSSFEKRIVFCSSIFSASTTLGTMGSPNPKLLRRMKSLRRARFHFERRILPINFHAVEKSSCCCEVRWNRFRSFLPTFAIVRAWSARKCQGSSITGCQRSVHHDWVSNWLFYVIFMCCE